LLDTAAAGAAVVEDRRAWFGVVGAAVRSRGRGRVGSRAPGTTVIGGARGDEAEEREEKDEEVAKRRDHLVR